MGFSLNNSRVRGELFTDTGKWKYTVCIDMDGYYYSDKNNAGRFLSTPEAVKEAFYNTDPNILGIIKPKPGSHKGWHLVVFDPCHEYEYPVMVHL